MSVTVTSYVPSVIKANAEGTRKGMWEIAVKVAAQAKLLSPVALVNGGLLRNSIMVKTKGKIAKHDGGPVLTTSTSEDEVIVGTATEYAVYQEYGTRKMVAQPFLRPAVDIYTNGTKGKDAMEKAMYNSVREKLARVSAGFVG